MGAINAAMSDVRAVLLAGGKGTRLNPITGIIPKPLAPVGNQPMMGHVLQGLADSGISNVHATTGYLADVMPRGFGDGSRWGVNLGYTTERELLGTAGAVKALDEQLGGALRDSDSPFVVLSGDGIHNFDVADLVRQHRESGAIGTMALHQVDDPSRFGVVELGDAGRIRGFQEKPPAGTARSNQINTGIYVFDPKVLDHIPSGTVTDFGHDVFPGLLQRGEHLHGVPVQGYWNDVGTLDSFRSSNLDVASGRVPGVAPGGISGAADALRGVHPTADVATGAQLVGTNAVGAGARIGDGAHVIDSVVLPGAVVPDGAVVANSIYGDLGGLRSWVDAGAP